MSQQNKNKQANRIYYSVKNTEIEFSLSKNQLTDSVQFYLLIILLIIYIKLLKLILFLNRLI
jgi:hypothetical protein